MCGCLSHTPNWGPAGNPDVCPDWESNRGPFGSQAGTQPTEPRQPGLEYILTQNWLFPLLCAAEKKSLSAGAARCHCRDPCSASGLLQVSLHPQCGCPHSEKERPRLGPSFIKEQNLNLADQGDPQILGFHRPHFKPTA